MSSKNSSSSSRVAILGGDGRHARRSPAGADVRYYQARRYGGNGEMRGLLAALAAGSIDTVIILARWNAHCVTRRVRAVCKRLGVKVVVEP